MILSCILLRKMDNVVVSGFGAIVGLGRLGETWALAKDARTEIDTKPTGTTTRAMDRNITGSNETIWKISMSSVPCGIGNRDGGINTSTFYCSDYSIIGRRSRHRFDILWKSAIPLRTSRTKTSCWA